MTNEQLAPLQRLLRLVIDNRDVIEDYESAKRVQEILENSVKVINELALEISASVS